MQGKWVQNFHGLEYEPFFKPRSGICLRKLGPICLGIFLGFVLPATATENPYSVVLDDPFPSASAPFDLKTSDYVWKGVDQLPTGSRVEWLGIEPQWTRVEERLVFPRTGFRLHLSGVESGMMTVQGRNYPLRTEGIFQAGEALVPLVSGSASQVDVRFHKGNESKTVTLRLQNQSVLERQTNDPSCSPFRLKIEKISEGPASLLVFAHCRLIREQTETGSVGSLDLLLWWDGADKTTQIDAFDVTDSPPSVLRIRMNAATPSVVVTTPQGTQYRVSARVPEKVNRGFFGMGIGPYQYRLLAPEADVNSVAGVLTVYGSYQVSDAVRLTAFNATTLNRNTFTDTGLYVKTDSAKFFDQRISVSLMLGANAVGFRYGGRTRLKVGAPQGFEAKIPDFFIPNVALTVGAFVYPPIDQKSYYNTWLRVGTPSFFGELNFLAIRDRFEEGAIYTRSAGISIGFPVARFF